MKCASALSTVPETSEAVRAVLDQAARRQESRPAELALAFATPHHAEGLGLLADELMARGLARHVLACTGESVVGDGREIESGPALSLWMAQPPDGVTIRPIRLTFDGSSFEGWPEGPVAPEAERTLFLLADPFSFPTDHWLKLHREREPDLRVVGGMASGGTRPGVNRLVLDSDVYPDGAIGLLMEGPVSIRTVVSQGCRPIGQPWIVTRARENIIQELGRRPALEAFREVFAGLDSTEQALVQNGLHLGRVINEYQESFQRGDFLVHNVLGADAEGGLGVTDAIRVGQTVQFHVRDATTADEDLRALLAEAAASGPVAGALLFTCNGRGSRLFSDPDHDALAIREHFGAIPTAGFFAMGEIGPVGGQNFVHGFTACVVLFEGERPESTIGLSAGLPSASPNR